MNFENISKHTSVFSVFTQLIETLIIQACQNENPIFTQLIETLIIQACHNENSI